MAAMSTRHPDLVLALALADAADVVTMRWWRPAGVASSAKADGSPVTVADIGVEEAVLAGVRHARPDDGFLGEELGAHPGTNRRRWIVDGIDSTRSFVAGLPTWGTLIALEDDGEIVVGVATSPAQDRRWWARRSEGAFTGSCSTTSGATPIRVSAPRGLACERVVVKPILAELAADDQATIERLAGGRPEDRPWSHQMSVAEGNVDVCVWFCGDTWDHAAPSVIVEEAGGRFSDHAGGRRLDTRTAVYSNGACHDDVLLALARAQPNGGVP